MSATMYNACKGLAYPLLATLCSCDHPKAQSKGYKDGWQMLLDKHDDNEMTLFCMSLGNTLSPAQSKLLLDGLAREYTDFATWDKFADACADYPSWKPSRETLEQHKQHSTRAP